MKRLLLSFAFLLTTGCASTSQSGIVARQCGKTSVQIKDIESFGFTPALGKINVMRIFATWCPYCAEDLTVMATNFKTGLWKPQDVHILLLAYRNRREDRNSFTKFVSETLPASGIPAQAIQAIFIDQDFSELSKTKSADGKPIFAGWQGVPFGLVFGKDGRLAFRGHFTNSIQMQETHYQYITELSKENCKPD